MVLLTASGLDSCCLVTLTLELLSLLLCIVLWTQDVAVGTTPDSAVQHNTA